LQNKIAEEEAQTTIETLVGLRMSLINQQSQKTKRVLVSLLLETIKAKEQVQLKRYKGK